MTGRRLRARSAPLDRDGAALPAGPLRPRQRVVLSGGSLANNAGLRETRRSWEIQGDPTEAAFLVAERKLGVERASERAGSRGWGRSRSPPSAS